jgi:hypothetical protein
MVCMLMIQVSSVKTGPSKCEIPNHKIKCIFAILVEFFVCFANWPKFQPQNTKVAPIKISAAGRNGGRIFCRFFKKWQKSGRTFLLCKRLEY